MEEAECQSIAGLYEVLLRIKPSPIVALNRPVAADLARELSETFLECIIAPGFDEEARERLATFLAGLDEPSEGLDPLMQEAFFAILRDRRAAQRPGLPANRRMTPRDEAAASVTPRASSMIWA